jgi:hypothetical protein
MLQLYARSWRLWWLPALLLGLLAMAQELWLQRNLPPLPQDLTPYLPISELTAFSAFASSGAFWYPLLAVVFASMLPFIALVLLFDRLLQDEVLPGSLALRRGLALWPGTIVAALCYALAVAAGTLLLLVPGALLGGRWLLWPVALVRQGGGVASLERGALLLRGRWWRVNGWVTLVFVLMLVAEYVAGKLLGWLPSPLSALVISTLAAPLVPLALVLAARGREYT